MQCLISITAARWNIVRAKSKRSKQDSLPQETGRAKSSRYIITCVSFRPEYGHNTMALRRVFYSLSLSTLASSPGPVFL